MRTMSTTAGLLGCVSVLSVAAAQAQVVRDVPAPGGPVDPTRRIASQWSFDLRATYSDNFRRIDDEQTRVFFRDVAGFLLPVGVNTPVLDPETGLPTFTDPATGLPTTTPNEQPITRFEQSSETISVEPPSNVIFTASIGGGTVYQRPGLTGIVRGSLTASLYADPSSIDERLSDDLATPAGPGVLPEGTTQEDIALATFGRTREEELFVRPDLTGSVTARIVPDLAYVDVAAIAQQQQINQREAVQGQADGRIGDVTTFAGGSVSPYLTREFASGATVEARYRLSGVFVVSEEFDQDAAPRTFDETDADADDPRFANDSVANEALLEYQSGQFFDRIAVTLRASAARSDESGSDLLPEVELTRLTGSAEGAYDLGRNLAVTGTIGYDDVTLDEGLITETEEGEAARENELSGVFWLVGAEYAPTQRSRFALSVGERFGGTQIDGQVTYRPTPRLSVSANAQRDLGTGTQDGLTGAIQLSSRTLQIVEQLAQIQSGSAREVLDRAVGFQGGFSNIQQQAFGVQVRNTFGLNASYTARRTDFALGVTYNDTEFGDGDDARQNTFYGVQGSVRRQVTRRLSASVSGRLDRVEGVLPIEAVLVAGEERPGAEAISSDQYFLSADLQYQLGPRFSVTSRAYRTASEGGGRGFGIAREFEENAVSAGIRWTF